MNKQLTAMSLRGLRKSFGSHIAVDGVDLDIPKGSFYGIVGPNGAGKTTMLSLATGLLQPDAGSVNILGYDLEHAPDQAKELLGVLPDGLPVFNRLSGAELVTYAGLLRGMDREIVAQRCSELLAALELSGDAKALVSGYSAGMTKKVLLACALIHSPKVLILDEPFEAVDPVSATRIREILRGYVQRGGTVVISSHVMALVEQLCDQVAVVVSGKVIAAGTLAEVRGESDLESKFVSLVGKSESATELTWLGQ